MDNLALIYAAVDEVNAGSETKIEKSPETTLLGDGSSVDSLMLVNLLVAVENLASERCGKEIMLMDEEVLSDPDQPLRTLGTLADYVGRYLKD